MTTQRQRTSTLSKVFGYFKNEWLGSYPLTRLCPEKLQKAKHFREFGLLQKGLMGLVANAEYWRKVREQEQKDQQRVEYI